MIPHCEQRPVMCSHGQYALGCRGDDCREAYRDARRAYRRGDAPPTNASQKWDRFGIRYAGDPDPSWREQAACKGLTTDETDRIFFPLRGEVYGEARDYCDRCPVKARCLDFALLSRCEEGMFGGKTPKERRKIRRTRKPIPTVLEWAS